MGLGDSIELADLESSPDEVLAAMRREEPVCWIPALEMWFVTKWDDVDHVESHPELFTAATNPSFLVRALGPNMLTCDRPEHTRVQAIMRPPFQPGGRSGDFARDGLPGLADQLVGELGPGRTVDLMDAYAQPLSAGALATVLGLDDHGFDTMWRWCEGLCADIANFENDPELTALGLATKAELGDAIADRIEASRDDDSAISWFVRNGATADEIVNNVRLMISGGINEPRDGIGMVVWILLTRPDLRIRVDAEPALMRRLIEEVFRVHSPVGTATRQATKTTKIGGTTIRQGDMVAAVLRSANLDEDHWSDPTQIDLDRREGAHAAFALGDHRCLGEWLGRQEVRVGVERLFAGYPNMELVEPVELHGFEFRGPKSVVVRLEPSPVPGT